MLKTIILVRHGESEKDKANPNRRLTSIGKSQVKVAAQKLKNLIKTKSCLIVTTKTTRTRQTATILAKVLDFRVKETQLNLRVDNFDLIEKIGGKIKDLTFFYFQLFKEGKLNPNVPAPTEIAERFLKIAGKTEEEVLIFVGHGTALEAFALFQDQFVPIRPLKEELKYAEFIVLERSKC